MVDSMKVDSETKEKYDRFVELMVKKYGAHWCAVIDEDGDIPSYKAMDESLEDKFLRSSRSLYWTFMIMGEAAGLPDLEGKYLETIWTKKYLYNYLYIMRLKNEVVMLGTENKIEEFMMRLISSMSAEYAPEIPGLVGFGIGDYSGNTLQHYLNMEKLKMLGGEEYDENEAKSIFEDITKEIFEKFMFMGKAGFGGGKYMEVIWENVTGWMFPYKDMVAVAVFETDKKDTIINIMSFIMENIDKFGD